MSMAVDGPLAGHQVTFDAKTSEIGLLTYTILHYIYGSVINESVNIVKPANQSHLYI